MSAMTIYALNRLTVSLKGFVEAEMPDCQLTHFGKDKYCGNCQMPKHKETEGNSFLIDERTGRASCRGKCNFQGFDITNLAAMLWNIPTPKPHSESKNRKRNMGRSG